MFKVQSQKNSITYNFNPSFLSFFRVMVVWVKNCWFTGQNLLLIRDVTLVQTNL